MLTRTPKIANTQRRQKEAEEIARKARQKSQHLRTDSGSVIVVQYERSGGEFA